MLLIGALRHLGDMSFEGKVCYAQAPASVSMERRILIDIDSCLVRFIHDTNHHKVQVDELVDHDFHAELSVAWREMSFDDDDSALLIEGTERRTKQRCSVYLQFQGEQAFSKPLMSQSA